ncbi:helix-turn-helix domain-containing protein [Ktedonobacter racemifer]
MLAYVFLHLSEQVTKTTLEKIARALHVKVADLIEEIADSGD